VTNVVRNAVIVSGLLLVAWASPATAHAELITSDPHDGSNLSRGPRNATLTFSEDIVSPAFVAVQSPDGKALKTTNVKVVGRTVTATVDDTNTRGRYSLSYRVVSSDGHPVQGTLHYTVDNGRSVKSIAAPEKSFFDRHWVDLVGGFLATLVIILLIRRRRDDQNRA